MDHRTSSAAITAERDSQDLTAALAALNSFQQVTLQADAKANTLVVVYLGLEALLTTRLDGVLERPGDLPLAVWLLGALVIALSLTAGSYLIRVILPRGAGVLPGNRFALAHIRGADSGALGARGSLVTEQAWEMAQAMAAIAGVKNRLVGRAIAWVAGSVVAGAAWLAVVAAVVH